MFTFNTPKLSLLKLLSLYLILFSIAIFTHWSALFLYPIATSSFLISLFASSSFFSSCVRLFYYFKLRLAFFFVLFSLVSVSLLSIYIFVFSPHFISKLASYSISDLSRSSYGVRYLPLLFIILSPFAFLKFLATSHQAIITIQLQYVTFLFDLPRFHIVFLFFLFSDSLYLIRLLRSCPIALSSITLIRSSFSRIFLYITVDIGILFLFYFPILF